MFSNTIKEIIEDYKRNGKVLTQNDLAKVLGMTKQSFSNKMQRDTCGVFKYESCFERGSRIHNKVKHNTLIYTKKFRKRNTFLLSFFILKKHIKICTI